MRNIFVIFLSAFLWISCGGVGGDILSGVLGGDTGTIAETDSSTASDSTTVSSTDSSDASEDSADSGDNSATSDNIGTSSSGDETEADTSTDTITDTIDSSDSGDSSNSPVASVPWPENDTGESSTVASMSLSPSFLVTSQSSDGDAIAQAPADSFEASSTVSIANTSYVQRLTQERERLAFLNPMKAVAQKYLPGFMSAWLEKITTPQVWQVPQAFAESGACLADDEGEVIATVNEDGSLDPTPVPDYNTGDVLSIAYCDPDTGDLGTAANDSALTHVVYLGDAPSSSTRLASADGSLFLLDDDGNIMEMNYDATGDRFYMDASINGFDGGYSLADAGTPSEVDVDAENDGYVFREDGVVTAMRLSSGSFSACGGGVCDSMSACSPTTGCSANNVKIRSGKPYFSTEYTTAQTRGSIQELYNNSSDRIEFINAATGLSPWGITLKSTKAFDVVMNADASSWNDYLVAFEDGSGNLRLFGRAYESSTSTTQPTVSLTLADISTVRDLIIYNAEDHAGSALFLYDRRLQFLTYDLNEVTCEEEDTDCTASTASITRGSSVVFADDENPVAVAINDAGTIAFVLNQGSDTESFDDDYVTVVDLTSQSRHAGLASRLDSDADGILPLNTFLSGKVIDDYSPSSIHSFTVGDDNYLFVGADNFDIGIVMGPF